MKLCPELTGTCSVMNTEKSRSAFNECIFPAQAGNMDKPALSFGAVIKQPSAILPLWLSLAALALLLTHNAFFGVVHEASRSHHVSG